MSRHGVIGAVFILALCTATYLSLEMQWRYAVVEGNLLNGNGVILTDWEHSADGVSLVQHGAEQWVCLSPKTDGHIPFLMRAVPLSTDFDYLRVSAETKADHLIPGAEAWRKGYLLLWSFDAQSKFLWYWPKKVAIATGISDWLGHELIVPVLDAVKETRLVAYNAGLMGQMCVRDLQVDGLREKRAFVFLRYSLFLAWAGAAFWVAVVVVVAPGSRSLKPVFHALSLLMLIAIMLPQPYYGMTTEPVERSVRWLIFGVTLGPPAEDSLARRPFQPPQSPGEEQAVREKSDSRSGIDQNVAPLASPGWLAEGLVFFSLEEILHATGFFLLAFFAFVAFPRTSVALIGTFLCLAVVASESAQLLLVTRSSEWHDLFADGAGAFIGGSGGALVRFGFGLILRQPKPVLPPVQGLDE